jgi:toxin ParE1/3/4
VTIRWTKRAIRSLESIHAYITKDNSGAAARVAEAILDSAIQLERFPQSGRLGRINGARELIVPGLPYIVPYRIEGDVILLLFVIHTIRKWPKKL